MKTFREYVLQMESAADDIRKAAEEGRALRASRTTQTFKDAAAKGNKDAIKALEDREKLKQQVAKTDFEAQWRANNS